MPSPNLLPTHERMLVRVRPGLRAFMGMLCRAGHAHENLAMFGLDLRFPAANIAGTQLLGARWVADRLRRDPHPVLVFPLAGTGDIAMVVNLVAPTLIPIIGRRPAGTIEVVLVDQVGDAAMAWLDPQELLRDCG